MMAVYKQVSNTKLAPDAIEHSLQSDLFHLRVFIFFIFKHRVTVIALPKGMNTLQLLRFLPHLFPRSHSFINALK